MNTNKFSIEEEATRTEADRISKETRRLRRDFGGRNLHFALDPRVIKDLEKEGHLCFVNDDGKGHLQQMKDFGYRFVTNREAYGERDGLNPDDRVMVRFGVMDDKNTPQDTYLMIQPWAFYEEDMAVLKEQTEMVDKTIMASGDEVDHHYGKRIDYKHN